MSWSVHPATYNRIKSILSLVFIFVFLVFVAIFYGVFWSILGFIILFFSLHSYYFPTYYEVKGDEVIIKNIFATQKRSLKEFRKVYKGKNGILLSPFKRKTFLNQFRGVFLLLPPARNDIEDFLKERIASYEEVSKDDSATND